MKSLLTCDKMVNRIVPVNPLLAGAALLGERVHPSLADARAALAADGIEIDMVDAALAIGARSLWLQPGVVHDEAAAKARTAGLDVVVGRCVKIEHRGRFG
ncbi:CoA-binding domain-containing protein [Burkholderia pseudomallei]|uniref:CoA-binding protein n=1 Tax=Burkholderia pseudomallei TaxID=28450 RepID=UPI00016A9D33|nr:CoA-binding protein [Burkholderia pseudomallei]KGX62121.1 coA binding domain protein [Burkholderia pseudomallei TSV5]KGX66213.1 coA binding domain protein [Burkholderia pseudomallei TSV28]MBF3771774.1 CoA-binding protein [Burkholderia pseudomallei]CAJ3005760.1 CoA-binding domain-containing protein [Burkholderia pseudomallei]CAJ9574396.1 CoA-binding domain-containing protein [Burkholderia pseudomallei]